MGLKYNVNRRVSADFQSNSVIGSCIVDRMRELVQDIVRGKQNHRVKKTGLFSFFTLGQNLSKVLRTCDVPTTRVHGGKHNNTKFQLFFIDL